MSQTGPLPLASGELLEELRNLPEEDRVGVVLSDERYTGRLLVELLIQLSHSLRYENPRQMLHWASLARIAADRTRVGRGESEANVADLKVRAWGHLGNSLRVCSHLREAEEALSIAQDLLPAGTGDPLLKARLLEQMASLHIFQRALDKAILLGEEAGSLYQALGEMTLLASSLVITATAHIYAGAPKMAVGLLNQAIPLIDSKEDSRLLLAASHNLVRCYLDLEMPEQAATIHRDIQILYQESADALILMRLSWLEGLLLKDMRHLKEAQTALLTARTAFEQRGMAYEASVISLDLSAVYQEMGLTEQARQAATEALPTFRALHVDRETLASLILAIRPLS